MLALSLEDFIVLPSIQSIRPLSGAPGEEITIRGTNFSEISDENTVLFNGSEAEILESRYDKIVAVIPSTALSGKIELSVKNQTVAYDELFTVGNPSIVNINPLEGSTGDVITVQGRNFADQIENNVLLFRDYTLPILSSSTDEIKFEVPEIQANVASLQIEVEDWVVSSDLKFKIVPRIHSFSPSTALPGTTIEIRGSNFSTSKEAITVSFNGITAELSFIQSSQTSLEVILPDEASSGYITVDVNGQEARSESTFSVEQFVPVPVITSFVPSSGSVGTQVTIYGNKKGSITTENEVRFNGVLATVISSQSNFIRTTVPTAASTGQITVQVNGQQAQSIGGFSVQGPAVDFEVSINHEDDDVEQAADGRMTLDSSDLELGEYDSHDSPDLGLQLIGLRFNQINIPQGVQIIEASIQFVADQTEGSDPTEMTIYGEKTADAHPYTDTDNDLSRRLLTSARAIWNIPPWTGTESGPNQRTSNLAAIVQEIVNDSGWSSGNSMNFIFHPTGVSAGATETDQGREAETYDDSNPNEGARLFIRYISN